MSISNLVCHWYFWRNIQSFFCCTKKVRFLSLNPTCISIYFSHTLLSYKFLQHKISLTTKLVYHMISWSISLSLFLVVKNVSYISKTKGNTFSSFKAFLPSYLSLTLFLSILYVWHNISESFYTRLHLQVVVLSYYLA
jgi:hypothetical protein